jgi:hypothetical protein
MMVKKKKWWIWGRKVERRLKYKGEKGTKRIIEM